MTTYKIELGRGAVRAFDALPEPIRDRLVAAIDRLKDGMQGDVRKLKGESNAFRLRVGDYRVLFRRQDDTLLIRKIAHRKEVYR